MPLRYLDQPTDDEFQRLNLIMADTFNATAENMQTYVDRVGRENIRGVADDEGPVGCMAILPIGQYFGGRKVPMAGIAAVGVSPHRRGFDAGGFLLDAAIRETHRREIPISTLFPATQPIYRRVGFEQAGSRFLVKLKLKTLSPVRSSCRLRPMTDADLPDVERLHRERCRISAGHLERNAFLWMRARSPRDAKRPADGYMIERGGTAEGYISVWKQDSAPLDYVLRVSDMVALSGDAASAILNFMAHHRSMADEAWWFGAPHDPLVSMLRDAWLDLSLQMNWMTRIVRPAEAMAMRGFLPGVSGDIAICLDDAILQDNTGIWMLSVHAGRGRAERIRSAPDGRMVRLTANGLAALYTGHLSGSESAALGHAEGPPEALDTLTALFAGPRPWMSDMF